MRHILPARLLSAGFKIPIWDCPICGRSFQKVSPCRKCVGKLTPAPAGKNALFLYDQTAKELIYGIKYRNILSPIAWIAKELIPLVPPKTDFITWIPASPSQKQKRGYDQSQLLARAISTFTKKPALRLLSRKIDHPQTHRERGQRFQGPKLYCKKFVGPWRILLVDDVITTGTSMRMGKEILESAGAKSVCPLGIAITAITDSVNR